MSKNVLTQKIPKLTTYSSLRSAVSETLHSGQKQIEKLKVQTYLRTGALIDRYLKAHSEKLQHGANVMDRLAEDLQLERSLFYRMLQFARAYPNVVSRRHLSWTHYRALLAVSDQGVREDLTRDALQSDWSVQRLRNEISKRTSENGKSAGPLDEDKLLEPKKNRAGIYRMGWTMNLEGKRVKAVDLGFHVYLQLKPAEARKFKEGKKMMWHAKKGWQNAKEEDDIYAYQAQVEHVVDGDTLLVQVEMEFGIRKRHYLRLRGLNAAERQEPEGRKAHEYLKRLFKKNSKIHFHSRRRDLYDRYISDVWSNDLYVNQELLDRGLTQKM